MTRSPRIRLVILMLALLGSVALAGCGRSQPSVRPPQPNLRPRQPNLRPPKPPKPQKLHGPHLWVSIAPNANQNSPIAVDVAAVTNARLLNLLEQTTVAQWFQQRTQWEVDNPGLLTVYSWQWVPGQQVAPIPLKLPGGTRAVLVFANYHDPKAKPLLIRPGGGGLSLQLLAGGVAGYGLR
ncbi:MAG: hypothetical protein ACRD1F_01860 [Terriglobales bacterium]